MRLTSICSWWLKPAAAYRDGIIDRTAHAITADENRAYAIVVNGSRELDMKPNGTFVYHAALDDPGALKLTKTMTSDTEKVVRVLRSWKLRSKLAPKAGLRYDGLYVSSPSPHSQAQADPEPTNQLPHRILRHKAPPPQILAQNLHPLPSSQPTSPFRRPRLPNVRPTRRLA